MDKLSSPSEYKHRRTAACTFSFPARQAGRDGGSLKALTRVWLWLNADSWSGSCLWFYALPLSRRLLFLQRCWLNDAWNTCVYVQEPNCRNVLGADSHRAALGAAEIPAAGKYECGVPGGTWGAARIRNEKRGEKKKVLFPWAFHAEKLLSWSGEEKHMDTGARADNLGHYWPKAKQKVDFQHNSLSPCRGEKGINGEEPE